jgi:hypothetical protein
MLVNALSNGDFSYLGISKAIGSFAAFFSFCLLAFLLFPFFFLFRFCLALRLFSLLSFELLRELPFNEDFLELLLL